MVSEAADEVLRCLAENAHHERHFVVMCKPGLAHFDDSPKVKFNPLVLT